MNYIAMSIPTSPGERAVWLGLHAVFKLACVFMGTRGAAPRYPDAGQGAAASAVALTGAKPSQTWLLVHVWCAGGSCKSLGLEKSGNRLRGQAGVTESLGAFLAC